MRAERKRSRFLAHAAVLTWAVAIAVSSADAPDTKPQPWPLWDGRESVADCAKRVNLPATQTLDLGNGVNLELVLIPAGKFVMGTPEPEEPKEGRHHDIGSLQGCYTSAGRGW